MVVEDQRASHGLRTQTLSLIYLFICNSIMSCTRRQTDGHTVLFKRGLLKLIVALVGQRYGSLETKQKLNIGQHR